MQGAVSASLRRLELVEIPVQLHLLVLAGLVGDALPFLGRLVERLLEHLKPRILLGLTATPERTDGRTVLDWFDGRIAVELRLWDALDRGLLSPFQYFGLHDGTDLSQVQ